MPTEFWTQHPICATVVMLAMIGCIAYCERCHVNSNATLTKTE